MSIYLFVINLFSVLAGVILLKHLVARVKYFVHMFQQSGYKQNEFLDWLKKRFSTSLFPTELALFTAILLFLVYLPFGKFSPTAQQIVLAIYILFWFNSSARYKNEKEKKPLVYTPRVKRLIAILSVIIVAACWKGVTMGLKSDIFWIELLTYSLGLLVAMFSAPFLLLLASFIAQPIETYIQNGFKKQARRKIDSFPNLTTVAITGSYGKTSTKFFMRDLLKDRFNVFATPGSYNTPMGICKVINNDLVPNHQVAIVEMGARYAGNIDELCEICPPKIAVWSNVGIAHLETFGTQENIAHTKGAIIRHLVTGGTAVVNADDPIVMANIKRKDIKVISCGISRGMIQATDISYSKEGCSFTVQLDTGESERFTVAVLGKHNIQNILLGVGVGIVLGIRLKTLAVAAKNIQPVEHRLELKPLGELTMIDDAFNSNPVGAANAVEILSQFSDVQRIIITPGMIELGDRQVEENEKFGVHIGNANLDMVYLVGKNQTAPILRGIQSTGFDLEKVVTVNSLFEANELLKGFAKPGDVVLYENDLPDSYNETA